MEFDTPYNLTSEQMTSFHSNGYLILSDLLSSTEVTDLQRWAAEVKEWPHKAGEHMHYEEIRSDGKLGRCRTENYANYHAGFDSLFRGKRLGGILGSMMGEPAVLFKEKINYKEAGGSGGFKAHIDANAYNHAGAIKHLTFLMAVDDMDMSNGCLEVVPGSHKMHVPLASDKCIEPKWEAEHNWIPVPMRAGSILLFGSYLAHRSGANSSSVPRSAIYATYNGISEGDRHDTYYAHRREAWPPTNERVEGKDYSEGALTFAYGSPMVGHEAAASAQARNNTTTIQVTRTIDETVTELFALLEAQGSKGYIGEDISQLEHSIQAAELARQAGANDNTITAALLHDIGQFLPLSTTSDMIQNGVSVGKKSHDIIGAAYLSQLGFPKSVTELVGAHVEAKRYLTAIDKGYYDDLSSASKASLKHQGGPYSPEEVAEFQADPSWKEKVALRRWDDAAKRTDIESPDLETFKPIVKRVLAGKAN